MPTVTVTPSVPPTVVVPVKSAWKSKINWGVGIALVASLASFLGFDFDAETQAQVQAAITSITAIYVWLMKTFFTTTVTPASLPTSSLMRD